MAANWPNTWANKRIAVHTYQAHDDLAGIAFVLTNHDPYTMIDIDGCVTGGNLSPLASEVIDRLDTYAEFSPSGKGLRLFVHCEAQPPTLKRPEIEIYSRERFATLTGNTLHQKPIARIDSLQWLYDRFPPQHQDKQGKRPTTFPPERATAPQDDAELWRRIFAVNALAKDIYNGNLTRINNQDPSRAVIMLLNTLALWTKGDAARMRQMMEQTALDKTKWAENRKGQDWLTGRIEDAISYMAGR